MSSCRRAICMKDTCATGRVQMRSVVQVGSQLPPLVLGVHVVRELNLDADRLSHPRQLEAVRRDAQRAWRRVVHVRVHATEWAALRAAIAMSDNGVGISGSEQPPPAAAPQPGEGRARKRVHWADAAEGAALRAAVAAHGGGGELGSDLPPPSAGASSS